MDLLLIYLRVKYALSVTLSDWECFESIGSIRIRTGFIKLCISNVLTAKEFSLTNFNSDVWEVIYHICHQVAGHTCLPMYDV